METRITTESRDVLLSIIVPVYNRPYEVDELLGSLAEQTEYDYEVIIIEDGSSQPCSDIVEKHRASLSHIRYLAIPNGGPSRARNIGAQEARGQYILILDSDVVLPQGYLRAVRLGIETTQADAFGGPDAASPDFSPMQQAVNFAMTSMLTTGGIRGGSASAMENFKPRTFNMGCRRELFNTLGGFSEDMRYGEDIDFSLRLIASGAKVRLFPEAYVYHKRRVDLEKFFMQVHHSGEARVELERRHPGSTKIVHLLPAVFTIYFVLAIVSVVGSLVLILYAMAIFIAALRSTSSPYIATLSVVTSFTQLLGYGSGYLKAKVR